MNSQSLIINNLEQAANQLVTYVCNNTTELKIALDEAQKEYKPFNSYFSYVNPVNYARWASRKHGPDFENLSKKTHENIEQKKLVTLEAMQEFFDKATAWTTTSAAYTLFNKIVNNIFLEKQREGLTFELLSRLKDLFLTELEKRIKLQKKLQVPTQPMAIPGAAVKVEQPKKEVKSLPKKTMVPETTAANIATTSKVGAQFLQNIKNKEKEDEKNSEEIRSANTKAVIKTIESEQKGQQNPNGIENPLPKKMVKLDENFLRQLEGAFSFTKNMQFAAHLKFLKERSAPVNQQTTTPARSLTEGTEQEQKTKLLKNKI